MQVINQLFLATPKKLFRPFWAVVGAMEEPDISK
jgi:hypothetical protein